MKYTWYGQIQEPLRTLMVFKDLLGLEKLKSMDQ